MQHKYFPNRIKMFSYLNSIVEGLDINRTIRLPNLWFTKIGGEDQKCKGTTEFCNKFNDVFGTKLDAKKSYSAGKRTVLFFDEEVLEDVVEETLSKEEECLEVQVQPDWDWINSLKNTKEDKELLDTYASDKFSISLNKTKKLENMVASFKESFV